jgi:hypothetical protein
MLQRLDDASLHQVVGFLTIREFFKLCQSCSLFNRKLTIYKTIKEPFFISVVYSVSIKRFRKLNLFDITNPIFDDFKDMEELWNNQDFARFVLQSKASPCNRFEIRCVPIIFRDWFDIKKRRVSIKKYSNILIEEAIKTNDLKDLIARHQFCKEYCSKPDVYMGQLILELFNIYTDFY